MFFLERWTDIPNAIVAPLCVEIAKIGRALNRMRVNDEPVVITDRGIDAYVSTGVVTVPLVFWFTKTAKDRGTWTKGKAYIAGQDLSIPGQPDEIIATETKKYWIEHDFVTNTMEWQSGTEYPTTELDTREIYRVLEITFEGGRITDFVCPHPCDIHATAKST